MAKTEQPKFIKVNGQYYMLETAAKESGAENLKAKLKELEGYFSHKGGGKETVPAKEPKLNEKDVALKPATDKEVVENVADKFSSPPKALPAKESKDLKSFQLKSETPKANEENVPQKMPDKIKVQGFIYERVVEPAAPAAETIPDKIRVKGEVYERVVQPPFIRVNGKTFVKLSDDEAREVLAAKSKAGDEPEKGWTKKAMQAYLDSIPGSAAHKKTQCVRKLKKAKNSKISGDPSDFCAPLADKAVKDKK